MVADHFRRQPKPRPAREQPVHRIDLEQPRRHARHLLIRRRHHDELVHRLPVPPAAHELGRQPVEQRRVRRPLALRAKVLRRFHDAGAKVHLPKTVHDHPRRQRVLRASNPLGQAEPVARRTGGPLAKRGRQTRADLDVAWLIVLPPAQHERLPRRTQFAHHHRRRRRLAKRCQRLPCRLELLLRLRLFFQLGNLGAVPLHLFPLRRAGHLNERLVRQLVRVADVRRLRHVVEQRVKLVKLPLRNRVVFVVVTPRAAKRQPEENRRRRLDAIHHGLDAVLLIDDASLALDRMVAVETSRHALGDRRVRQQVAGELLEGEPVERHVVVESADHPVAPRPHHAAAVKAVPVRVGVARGVEPVERHPFAVTRRRQQLVDDALVRARRCVGEEGINLTRSRRQTGEVEAHAPKQSLPVRARRGLQPGPLQLGQDESVNRAAWPGGIFRRGNCWPLGRDERPVFLPLGAL